MYTTYYLQRASLNILERFGEVVPRQDLHVIIVIDHCGLTVSRFTPVPQKHTLKRKAVHGLLAACCQFYKLRENFKPRPGTSNIMHATRMRTKLIFAVFQKRCLFFSSAK